MTTDPQGATIATVPDAQFADPRLAALYDVFEGDARPDLPPYVQRAADLGARTVLDVGCGTGVLAARLADRGFTVFGADPAAASLAIARARSPRVTWIEVGAADLPALEVDLAVMTGNVAQVFVTDQEWTAALGGVARALRPGGSFVFETRRPAARAWDGWALQTDLREAREADGGRVRRRFEVLEASPPLVTFRDTFTFEDGTETTSTSTLRFRELDELHATLVEAGFTVSDVRQAPDRPGLEFVVTAAC